MKKKFADISPRTICGFLRFEMLRIFRAAAPGGFSGLKSCCCAPQTVKPLLSFLITFLEYWDCCRHARLEIYTVGKSHNYGSPSTDVWISLVYLYHYVKYISLCPDLLCTGSRFEFSERKCRFHFQGWIKLIQASSWNQVLIVMHAVDDFMRLFQNEEDDACMSFAAKRCVFWRYVLRKF